MARTRSGTYFDTCCSPVIPKGTFNTAFGKAALFNNVIGRNKAAFGDQGLLSPMLLNELQRHQQAIQRQEQELAELSVLQKTSTSAFASCASTRLQRMSLMA